MVARTDEFGWPLPCVQLLSLSPSAMPDLRPRLMIELALASRCRRRHHQLRRRCGSVVLQRMRTAWHPSFSLPAALAACWPCGLRLSYEAALLYQPMTGRCASVRHRDSWRLARTTCRLSHQLSGAYIASHHLSKVSSSSSSRLASMLAKYHSTPVASRKASKGPLTS